MARKAVLFGAQGSAREIAWLAAAAGVQPVCFVDRENSPRLGTVQNGLPVLSVRKARRDFPDASAILAVGEPMLRRRLESEGLANDFSFTGLLHPGALISSTVEIGEGLVCYPQTIVTTNVVIGRHVQINLGVTVSHDTLVGDFVTLSPGARICGYVGIEDDVFIGAGATVINGTPDRRLTIGKGAVIAAGACVTGDIGPGTRVAGVPARPMRRQVGEENGS